MSKGFALNQPYAIVFPETAQGRFPLFYQEASA